MAIQLKRLSSVFLTLVLGPLCSALIYAHDDGLTCHEHSPCVIGAHGVCFSGYFNDDDDGALIEIRRTRGEQAITLGALIHRFDNLLALDAGSYDPESVRLLRAGFTELRQSLLITQALLSRSEAAFDADDSDRLRSAARSAYSGMGLSAFLDFREILAASAQDRRLIVELEEVTAYLAARYGLPDKLRIALDNAAASC